MGRSKGEGKRTVVGGSWVKERDDEGLVGNGGRLGDWWLDWRLGGKCGCLVLVENGSVKAKAERSE